MTSLEPCDRQQTARLRRREFDGRRRCTAWLHTRSSHGPKTGRPVKFEITEQTRQAVDDCLNAADKKPGEFLFIGRRGKDRSLTTRQYARLVSQWIASIGLDPSRFGTHSLRRTKATLISAIG